MNLSRNLIQGGMGGWLGGAILGLVEAVTHLATSGAPDLLAPFYAVVLYAIVGLPLGVGGGLLVALWERRRGLGLRGEATAFAAGASAAIAPVAVFVLLYVVNKVAFAEAGVPTAAKLGIVAAVGAVVALLLTVGIRVLRGPLAGLLKGPGALGAWAALAAVTLGVSFVPTGADPRATWAHGKPVPPALADRPNVLVIAVDTLRADYLGAYGKAGDPSPTLDAIGTDGIVFEQAFAAASWTRSSFATLWTSQLPSSHNADTKAARLADELVLVSEVLQQAGVTTGNLVNNINVTSTFNFDQGWDTFLYESPDYAFGATESVFQLTLYKVVHKLAEKLGGAKVVTRFYQPAEVVLADAKGFIEANRGSRWFLGVHLMEPHDPYFEHPYLQGGGPDEFNGVGFARAEVEHPDPAQAPYLKEVYTNEIRHMDNKLRPFVDWLKAEGLYDDLLIVVTSDHGEEFGEHGGFWHGTTLYEEQIRVPLIVKLPKGELAGTRVAWQARTLDVAPTLAAALGLAPGPGWQGQDLVADVRAERAEIAANAQKVAEAQALIEQSQPVLLAGEATPELLAQIVTAQDTIAAFDPTKVDPCAGYRRTRERVVVAEEDFEGNVLGAIRQHGLKLMTANAGNPRGLPESVVYDVVVDPHEQAPITAAPSCGASDALAKLPEALRGVVEASSKQGASGGDVKIDQAEKCKLCALGYLSGPDCDGC